MSTKEDDSNKKATPSQQLSALKGPVEEIENLQISLSAILSDVLQRRNLVKKFFATEIEAEEEINRICATFTAANRRKVAQSLMNAYTYNRYPIVKTIIPTDAPEDTNKLNNEKKEPVK